MLTTALILGITGSLHCIGMCSPLSMAVTNRSSSAMLNKLIYNLGRILTYGILGAFAGSLSYLLPLQKFQHVISIAMGISLLIIAITGIGKINVSWITKFLGGVSIFLKQRFASLLQRKNVIAMLLLGALNGLLPCGLTLIALTFSIASGSPVESFLFMIIFGIGTLPAMLGAAGILQYVIRKFHISSKKLTMVMLVISGCMLIGRVFLPHEHHNTPNAHEIVICR